MEDLRHYSDQELSIRVFNEEYLYDMRMGSKKLFIELLDNRFIYSDLQFSILVEDLKQDREEFYEDTQKERV